MVENRKRWLYVGVLCLVLWPIQTLAQQATWEQHIRAGVVAYKQGNYAEAEKQWNAGLGVAEAFGTEDPRYATSLNNLALLYKAQGRYGDAEPFYKRALAIREKALGPEHPHVATSLNNLALLYQAQGRYGDAEPFYKRALAIFEKALGPEHPNVATSLVNYAVLLRKIGRDAEAERMETRAKKMRNNHPEWTAR